MLGLCSFTFSAQWHSINVGINFMIDNLILKNQSEIYQNGKNCVITLNKIANEAASFEVVTIKKLSLLIIFT